MKEFFLFLSASIGILFQHFFGAWDKMLEALVVFMLIDIVSGVTVALLGKSKKSKSGRLWSAAMREGLIHKGLGLLFVVIAVELDALAGSNGYIRSATIFCILTQELLSIAENCALLGKLPLPSILKKTLDVLNEKNNKPEGGK
jgi:toxin secretion/phage lysis holin